MVKGYPAWLDPPLPQGLEIGESYCENTKKTATSDSTHDPYKPMIQEEVNGR